MNYKQSLIIATVLGALTVSIGAFGAHALRPSLEAAGRLETFETGVKYQMYHALAIFLTGLLQLHTANRLFNWASLFFFLGILIFSGSLYALSLSGITKLGAIAPIGGVLFIAGWISLLVGVSKIKVPGK